MLFSAILASGVFLYNGSYERAAQLVLMGVCLQVAKSRKTLTALLFAPFVSFAVFGLVIEIIHFVYRRKYCASREMWKHIEDIRARTDLETVLQLMLERQTGTWTMKQWAPAAAAEQLRKQERQLNAPQQTNGVV
jgi:hypothetical protein